MRADYLSCCPHGSGVSCWDLLGVLTRDCKQCRSFAEIWVGTEGGKRGEDLRQSENMHEAAIGFYFVWKHIVQASRIFKVCVSAEFYHVVFS